MRLKRLTATFVALALGSAWVFAQAQTQAAGAAAQQAAQPRAPAPLPDKAKIAFIDLERALSQCGEGQKEFGEVNKFIEEKSKELQKRQEEIDKLRNQLQAQARTLSDESRLQLQREIEQKEKELNRFREDTQSYINDMRDAALNKIGNKMKGIIDSYAREEGLAMVFVVSQQTMPLYAYLNSSFDITDEIIQRYDKTYPVGAAQQSPGVKSAQPPASQPAASKPKP